MLTRHKLSMKPSALILAGVLLACAAGHAQAQPATAKSAADAGKPYHADADARKDIAAAQARARTAHKSVMVIFGANWCPDCIVLHRTLEAPESRDYVESHFEIVSVDVGQFNKNLDVAKSLDVNLNRGIPAAAFLAWDGTTIGNTNNGELEPSRNYHSDQILRFLHEVVDNHKITTPK